MSSHQVPIRSTIIDVAKLAGVSIKTVSRVLNNEPRVRNQTRQKVEQAVQELGYQPNLQARQLRSARSFLIGLMCGDNISAYTARAQLGAVEACRDAGYHLLVEPCESGSSSAAGEKMERLIRDTRPDGLLLLPPFGDSPAVKAVVRRHKIPYCCMGQSEIPKDAFAARIDDESAAYDMTVHLIGLGHRSIGFIKGNTQHTATHDRFEGFLRAMSEANLAVPESNIAEGDFSYRSGINAADKLLGQTNRPTAIYASNDDMAAAVVSIAYKHNMTVPTDLSVAGFDDSDFSRKIWPTLTTVRQPISEMAMSAVSLLLDGGMKTATADDCRIATLDYELICRASTAELSH